MNDRVYDGYGEGDMSAAARLIYAALLSATKQSSEQVHFSLMAADDANPKRVSVSFEKAGRVVEGFVAPSKIWPKIVGRLKVMAFFVPSGLTKIETRINLRLSENRIEHFDLTLSPMTEQEGSITVRCAGSTIHIG